MQDQNTTPITTPPQTPLAPQPANDPGRVMAILGIVFAVLPLQLVGLVLSIIAKKKAIPGSSTNTLSTIGIVLNAVLGVIVAVGFFVIALTALSGIQNAATANAFLAAVQEGDIDKAASYTDEPDDTATKTFLRNAAAKVGTGRDQIDSATKGDLHGFSYELEGGSAKYARVTVESKDGKRHIYEFVFGNEKVVAMPREQKSFAETSDTPEVSSLGEGSGESSSPAARQCVTSRDIGRIPTNSQSTSVTDSTVFSSTHIFFNANSVTYQYPEVTPTYLSDLATYIKSLDGKSFAIEIQGAVSADRTTSAMIELANNRSTKLKQELVSYGVPAALITVRPANMENNGLALSGHDSQKLGVIELKKSC